MKLQPNFSELLHLKVLMLVVAERIEIELFTAWFNHYHSQKTTL